MIARLQTTAVLAYLLAAIPASPSQAEEFRIESKVYAGNERQPVSESLSLFHDDKVYDFLSSPEEITVFDLSRDRITLVNPGRGVHVELSSTQLVEFCEKVRARASRQGDPLLKFASHPEFQLARDEDGRLVYSSPEMTYRVHVVTAESPAIAAAYREFADLSARLNTMTQPGGLPPFPRLSVNAALARDGQLPATVEVTLAEHNRGQDRPATMRSEHRVQMGLDSAARERMARADESLASSKRVPLSEYLRAGERVGN